MPAPAVVVGQPRKRRQGLGNALGELPRGAVEIRPPVHHGGHYRELGSRVVWRSLEEGCKLGVLALGDSITNGGGELQWGVALQSWALWTARGLGLPFSSYAVDGARAADVAGAQIAAFEARAARPGARYDVGCLYAGVNDVRAPDWEPAGFERDLRTALAFLSARCDRVLACTIPLDLGRPRAGARVPEANALIRRAAADH